MRSELAKCSSIDAAHTFWEQVWQSPQNYDAISRDSGWPQLSISACGP